MDCMRHIYVCHTVCLILCYIGWEICRIHYLCVHNYACRIHNLCIICLLYILDLVRKFVKISVCHSICLLDCMHNSCLCMPYCFILCCFGWETCHIHNLCIPHDFSFEHFGFGWKICHNLCMPLDLSFGLYDTCLCMP